MNLEDYGLINTVMDLQSDGITWRYGTLQPVGRRRPLEGQTLFWDPASHSGLLGIIETADPYHMAGQYHLP